MNSGQRRTLEALFADPIPVDIKWSAAMSLLVALGAEIKQTGGSMTILKLNGRRAVIHKPHPRDEMGRGRAKHIRIFLENAGINLGDLD